MEKNYTSGYYYSADGNGGHTPIGAASDFDYSKYTEKTAHGNETDLIYETGRLKVTVHRLDSDSENTIVQYTTYENRSEEPLILETASTFFVEEISKDVWSCPKRFKVYTCKNFWEGEGQWRSDYIETLGIYKASSHTCFSHIVFSSQGSWSTAEHYPLIIIEDTMLEKSWFFELEGGFQWLFEIGVKNGSLCVMGTQATLLNGGFSKLLKRGGSFTTPRGFFGFAAGGFEVAVRELTSLKRRFSLRKSFENGTPLVFNDYMNCLWAMPSYQKLIPLIDAAASVGCEIFCMDDGWLDFKGDWQIKESLYGEHGLHGIINYIQAKGMRAGIWLEIESAAVESVFAKNTDNLLLRNGRPVGTNCKMVDFRRTETREHIKSVIDKLYSMGIRYIKNDYNMSTVVGIDGDCNPCENLISHANAFYRFIDMIYRDYPDMIIENCGSGAMRSDNGTLMHFDLQSTSDQEIFTRYPSIAAGSVACMPPEKAGIWAYPYPMLYDDRLKPLDELFGDEYKDSFSDGEQTAFNMVTGLCGTMYLSGHIEYADELNRDFISEAVQLFKKYRADMAKSYPFWPLGLKGLNDCCWNALGFSGSDGSIVMLAVWKINASEDECEIDLSKRLKTGAKIQDSFPRGGSGIEYNYNSESLSLKLKSDKPYPARWFAFNNLIK